VVDTVEVVAEAEDSMAEVVIMEGIPEDIEVDTLVDSMAGILVVDTVLRLHLEDILVATMVATTEDTEGDTMVGIVEATTVGIVVDIMVEDFTHIGDLD
jgi:hypothetical protein